MTRPKRVRPKQIHDSCRTMTELLADYLDDRLTAGLKREFEEHLKICPDCVSFLNTYRKTVQAESTLKVDDMPPAVRASLLAFIRRKIRKIAVFVISLLSPALS